ncbi:MAG: lysine transporter LysE [Deltaproteobacteria bacterium]|nr:MAG: lysine transporter LysE [Deltaproteobacteria bacterium]
MSIDHYIAFLLASAVILVIPGPTILLVVGQAMAHGRRSVVPLTIGVLLGDFTAMTLSLIGLGAVLSTSAALFSIFKLLGSAYLIYLGVKMWRTAPSTKAQAATASGKRMPHIRDAWLVTTLNPKSIAFFVAFLPHFVDTSKPPLLQFIILGATFLVMATINAALYAIFAAKVKGISTPRSQRFFARCGGTALLGAGVMTATLKRAT